MGKTKRKSINLVGGSTVAASTKKRKRLLKAKSRRKAGAQTTKSRGSARSTR